ncbi:MAG: hypothetical protein EON60_03270 [Alphaproteobacteria bacterium]|nr:MAG: hypothetical protein EON60_03270 [Alphaproteobacteria bacterium]
MNAPYNTPVGNEPTIMDARKTCRELLALLIEENNGLAKRDISMVEASIQNKRRLTLRLEQILADLKRTGSLWKADAPSRQQANLLAEEIAEFQTMARENAMMLKAAHQLRADIILAIRDTVDTHQPQAQTYGSNGSLNTSENTSRLITTSI